MAGQSSNQIKIQPSDLGFSNTPPTADQDAVGSILGAVYVLAGIVAVIVIVIGGIRYVASNGDSGQVQSAKNTVTYAVVGLIVVIAAAAITQFVINGTKG